MDEYEEIERAEIAQMGHEDSRRLSRDVYPLRRLLVVTWMADGKTREQIEAFCDAALLDPYMREDLLVMFDRMQPKTDAVCRVRVNADNAPHRVVVESLKRFAGNEELALADIKRRGFA